MTLEKVIYRVEYFVVKSKRENGASENGRCIKFIHCRKSFRKFFRVVSPIRRVRLNYGKLNKEYVDDFSASF